MASHTALGKPPAAQGSQPKVLETRRAVAVLEADSDLGRDLDAGDLAAARRDTLALVESLPLGSWHPEERIYDDGRGYLGLLILEGLLTRDVVIANGRFTELIGAGDLLRPWEQHDEYPSVPCRVDWTILEPTTLAVLDRRFAVSIGRWPEITAALLGRALRRSRWLTIHLATEHLGRVDLRLLVLLWHVADRWGHVSSEGVIVPLRLTHTMLGNLIGAQRPSVTTALKRLKDDGLVTRHPDGSWLLRGRPPEALCQPEPPPP